MFGFKRLLNLFASFLICATLIALETSAEKERNSRFRFSRRRLSGRRGENSDRDFDLDAFIFGGTLEGSEVGADSSGTADGKTNIVVSGSKATIDQGVASALGSSAGVAVGDDKTAVDLTSKVGVNDNKAASAAQSSATGSLGASASSGHSSTSGEGDKLTFGAVAASAGVSLNGPGGASSRVSGRDKNAGASVGSGTSVNSGDISVSTSLSALSGGNSRGDGKTDIFGESSSFGLSLSDNSDEDED